MVGTPQIDERRIIIDEGFVLLEKYSKSEQGRLIINIELKIIFNVCKTALPNGYRSRHEIIFR